MATIKIQTVAIQPALPGRGEPTIKVSMEYDGEVVTRHDLGLGIHDNRSEFMLAEVAEYIFRQYRWAHGEMTVTIS
jgi:hypothetical protein